MQPTKYQLQKSVEIFNKLKQNKFCLLQGEVRSTKTLTALLALSYSKTMNRILFITKKKAIPGIEKFINDPELSQNYFQGKTFTLAHWRNLGKAVIRQTHKITGRQIKPVRELQPKYNPNDYDFIIGDELHELGKVGPKSLTYELMKLLGQDKPWLGMSGTMTVETATQIYYQTTFSTKTPFPQPNFYRFFDIWGIPNPIQISRNEFRETYKVANPKLLPYIATYSVFMTQKEAGVEFHAEDKLHYVKLNPYISTLYNQLQRDRIVKFPDGTKLIADSTMALRTQLHQMEGGTIKADDTIIYLNTYDKINYIKQTWGDTPDIGIMSYYVAEQKLLKEHFKQAQIYSSISNAEGVDLSHLKVYILYSFGFSGAKFVQLRDRITNINGSGTTEVQILLTKDGLSEQVYKAVKEKKNFNDSTFKLTQPQTR